MHRLRHPPGPQPGSRRSDHGHARLTGSAWPYLPAPPDPDPVSVPVSTLSTASTAEIRTALVGHPNSGKTSLFNALTGRREKVGNYTGVTVSRKTGTFRTPHGRQVTLTDLPGAYSLSPNSPDEEVTRDALLDASGENAPFDLVLCILDATNLERHLTFLLEVVDLGYPVIGVLNKTDLAESQGLRLDPTALSEALGVPILAISASTKRGLTQLRQAIRFPLPPAPGRSWQGSLELEAALTAAQTTEETPQTPHPLAEGQALQQISSNPGFSQEISSLRRARVTTALDQGLQRPDEATLSLTDRIDSVALHPLWGWGFFAALMFGVFWLLFSFAGLPMEWIENATAWLSETVAELMPPGDLRDLIVDGIIGGVGSVLVFLPQIVLLFLFISLLESSGYMARAAFLMDRVMSKSGLSGKAFLPLLSGYACAIPGVMATRTIPSARERLATILILPWTSCSARLPVYVILVPLMVAGTVAQTATLFGIYALGTVTALLVAKILKPRLGPTEPSQFLLELPPYHAPCLRYVLHQVWDRALSFVKKAGSIILGISILLWFLNTYPKSGSDDPSVQQDHSFMGRAGHLIEPLVRPLGWDDKIGTAMLTSFAAREVFVSSLAISYSIEEDDDAAEDTLRSTLEKATRPDGSKVFTLATILSLLIFYIYALQCLPTTAVVRRETNSWKWALGQLSGMTLFAYVAALFAYQAARLFT